MARGHFHGIAVNHLREEKPDSCPQPDRAPGVAGLAPSLASLIQRVSYHQAEAGAKSLAAQFIAASGQSELARGGYAAIPRGRLFVLGMLAYVLDLDPRPLLRPPADAPVVVVDGCVLTGFRFQQTLHRFLTSV